MPADVFSRVVGVFAQIHDVAQAKLKKGDELRLKAEMVFLYWVAKFDHANARLDQKRGAKIVSRLKENDGDVSELLYALDGAHNDEYIMARGEYAGAHRKYDGIETIFRERSQVERFANTRKKYRDGVPHGLIPKLEEALHAPAREAVVTAAEVAHA